VGATTETIINAVAWGRTDDHKPYCALIDLGAQLTGLSNFEIAQLLLKEGLLDERQGMCVTKNLNQPKLGRVSSGGGFARTSSADGVGSATRTPTDAVCSAPQAPRGSSNYSAKFKHVPNCLCKKVCVFLDGGKQMFIDRNQPEVQLPIDRCHVPLQNRFTFFDQVHTTGIDTKQPLDGVAVCTVGSGITLRDFFQGCWRMRKIGAGQKIHLMCVPEVQALMQRDLALDAQDPLDNRHVLSWLCLNSVILEEKQKSHMNVQVLSSIWRRFALSMLVDATHVPDASKLAAVSVFREFIDLKVPNFIKMHPSSFEANAFATVQAAAPFIAVVKTTHPQIETEIQQALAQDSDSALEADQSWDYQMILEQDREKDEERERAVEVNRFVACSSVPEQKQWNMDCLCKHSSLFLSASPFFSLAEVQTSGAKMHKLDLPTLLSSPNFCPKTVTPESRLKHSHVLVMFRMPDGDHANAAKRQVAVDEAIAQCGAGATADDIKAAFASMNAKYDFGEAMMPADLEEIRQRLCQRKLEQLTEELLDVCRQLRALVLSDTERKRLVDRVALDERKRIIQGHIDAARLECGAELKERGLSSAAPPSEQPIVCLLVSLDEAASLRRATKMPQCSNNPLVSMLLPRMFICTTDPQASRLVLKPLQP